MEKQRYIHDRPDSETFVGQLDEYDLFERCAFTKEHTAYLVLRKGSYKEDDGIILFEITLRRKAAGDPWKYHSSQELVNSPASLDALSDRAIEALNFIVFGTPGVATVGDALDRLES